MNRRTRVSRRHVIATMVAGLGVLVTACGPGTNPGAAPKTDSKPAEASKPAESKPAAGEPPTTPHPAPAVGEPPAGPNPRLAVGAVRRDRSRGASARWRGW